MTANDEKVLDIYIVESPSINGFIVFSDEMLAKDYARKHCIVYRIKKGKMNYPTTWEIVENESYPI